MDPTLLIPAPDPIPVHWGWFQFLLLLTFVLHLLVMNTMLGTGIIALVTTIRGKTDDIPVAKEISTKLPYTIAFAINLGVAPLLFVQVLYGHCIYTSSILMAGYWLCIIPMLLIAYYSAYIYDFKFDTLGSARSLFIAAAVVCMLLIAFLFSNNMTLMLTPQKWFQYFDHPDGTVLNLSEPTLIPRYWHFVFASVAVGGLFLALVGKLKGDRGQEGADEKMRQGMKWFAYATVLQIPIGFWFQMSLPREIMILFMGANTSVTALFALGLTGTILAVVFGFQHKVWPGIASTLGVVIIMALLRDIVRRAYLEPFTSVSTITVEAQYWPLIIFLAVLVLGLGMVGYMLKLVVGAGFFNLGDKTT